ncbi:MAG TPA: alpha/beta hydrolase [Acidimicrobiales bacterium]|nr:alpha/beta hydrolase [Acidimicrobiales bacterium]
MTIGPTGEPFDELAVLREAAAESGVPWPGDPVLARREVEVAPGRRLSAIVWGDDERPATVLLHGGQQNAHTWDLVALAYGRPALAVDLAGHGSSDPVDRPFDTAAQADDLAVALGELAASPAVVAGMSLGGLSAITLAAVHPDLVARLVVVDVTPGVVHGRRNNEEMFGLTRVESFDTFEDMVEAVVRANPRSSPSSLRRGLRYNARQRPDGRWAWRFSWGSEEPGEGAAAVAPFASVWDDLAAVTCPVTLVTGSRSAVVTDEDRAAFRARQPAARMVVVEGAGHSVQGSRPVELARLLRDPGPA